jgi:hypothetical protein
VLKSAHIPNILACHLQTNADLDSDPDPAYHFDANSDPDPSFQFDADPDPQHCYSSDCVHPTGRGATCEEEHKEEARAGGLHCQGGPGQYQIYF